MQRLTAIFIATCVILIGVSVGAIGYLMFRLSGAESAIVALAVITALALYNTVSARLRDRNDVGAQISDLSRGTGDLARQVAEIGRRLNTIETQEGARRSRAPNDPLAAEIGELGTLVKELAETVASHDARFDEIRRVEFRRMEAGPAAPVILTEAAVRPAPQPPAPEPEPVTRLEPVNAATQEPQASSEIVATGPLKGMTPQEITDTIGSAIEEGRIDLYLQPVVTLPQRKVRYYEAMTRLRTEDGTLILPSDFLVHAEKAGQVAKIDNTQLFRCVQVLRRLLLKNREIGLFCNVSIATLNDPEIFRQFYDFLEANRALSSSLMLEFTQSALLNMGPIEQESLSGLIALGYRFSMDHVNDLRLGPRDLSELGVRFVKVPAHLLLNRAGVAADIHAADLSDLLGRHGISLIAERIETEAVVVDLLDYDVRFGQGFLFSPPRPVRADALHGVAAVSAVADRTVSETTIGAAARAAIGG